MNTDLLAFFIHAIAEAELFRSSLDDEYSIRELVRFASDLQYNGFLTAKGKRTIKPFLSQTPIKRVRAR